jgi:hypothetical protein
VLAVPQHPTGWLKKGLQKCWRGLKKQLGICARPSADAVTGLEDEGNYLPEGDGIGSILAGEPGVWGLSILTLLDDT